MGYDDYTSSGSRNTIVLAAIVIAVISVPVFLYFWTPYENVLTTTTDTTTDTTTTTPQDIHNPYEVAIVFATQGLGDKSFNDMVYEGANRTQGENNVNFTYVEPTSILDYETYLRQYANHSGYTEPYDLIISIGFDQGTPLEIVAEEFPNQKFAIIDMYLDPEIYPNVASLLFSEHEGSALVGAIAGLMTQTNEIGFIGGMDIPLVSRYAAGYIWGANYTNEGINFSVAYTWDWADTTTGQSVADGIYTAGADVIFTMAGRSGLGVFRSAKNNNGTSGYPNPLWVIGSEVPQMYLGCADPDNPVAPTIGLTTMIKRVDVAVYDIILETVFGSWTGGEKVFDLSNGGVDYEINTDLLTLHSSVIDAVEDLKDLIIAGTVVVPDAIYWT